MSFARLELERRHTLKFNEDYTVLESGDFEYLCSQVYRGIVDMYQHSVICYQSLAGGNNHSGVFFMFDKKTLRYVRVAAPPTGYLSEGRDTNTIYAGTCEKF